MKVWSLILALLWVEGIFGQTPNPPSEENFCRWRYSVSFQNNSVALPASGKYGFFHGTFHPGFVLGAGYTIKEKPKVKWVQQVYLGFVYHRLVHSIFSLHTENEGRFRLFKNLYGSAGLGAGFAQVINTKENKVYKLNEDGTYKQTYTAGRTKGMGSFSLGLSYIFSKERFELEPFIKHQFWMIFPFVKSYVPLLPNVSLQAGVGIRLKNKTATK